LELGILRKLIFIHSNSDFELLLFHLKSNPKQGLWACMKFELGLSMGNHDIVQKSIYSRIAE